MNINKDVLEALGALGINPSNISKNANEVMHTTNTNKGAELVPSVEFAAEIFDAIPSFSPLMAALPGNHGVGLGKSEEVDIIGDVGFFDGHTEKTTGAFALAQGNKTLATDKVTITQKQLDLTIDVSNELANFNRLGAAGLEAKLKEKIGKAAARTIEAMIINGDTTSGATGNVNSDDGAPTSTAYYLQQLGLRYYGVAGSAGATKIDVGTMDFADIVSVYNLLGNYGADPSEVLWLWNRATYNKALTLDEFSNAAKNGKGSTINTGAITNILGSDVFIARDMPLTEADGKVNTASPSATLLGEFMAFWKPAVQFGFGQELQLWLAYMGKDGWQLQGWFNYGQAIVQKKAGVTDSSLGLGFNVTV